ncbi:uncharacterized protein [Nicotiana sylvestris]|uniref:uncharacterized protein n=1 Tax=Nicotiana sylvestris TaxID=4096 RepID=UPI00388CDF23
MPLVKALEQMPEYAKFMKDLVTKKRSMNCETIKMTLEDPGTLTILCTIGSTDFAKASKAEGGLRTFSCFFSDVIVSPVEPRVSQKQHLYPFQGRVRQPRPTSMRLQMADRTMKRPLGIIDDVLVRVDKFILPSDFVSLDCEVYYEVTIILGRPFLKALVDVEAGELTFRVGDEKVVSMRTNE